MTANDSLLGKTVEWTSQSAGISTTKRGVVIYDGRPLQVSPHFLFCPKEFVEALCDRRGRYIHRKRHRADYLASYGLIVLVERVGKRGKPLLPWSYAPRREHVRVVVDEVPA